MSVIDKVLKDFNWEIGGDSSHLEAKLREELGALEAANIHSIIQSEDQANEVIAQIDTAVDQLTLIDEWLNHYTNVLDSMGADVHQVEVRNKNLQTASNNQKILLQELDKLVSSLKLPSYIIEILKNEPLDFTDGILQCEEATIKLNEAIKKKFDNENMNAVKERINLFQGYGNEFALRLCDYLSNLFSSQIETYLNDEQRVSKKGSLKLYGIESFEEKLYRFRKLLAWLKDFDPRKHQDLQMKFTHELSRIYKKELHDLIETLLLQHTVSKINYQDQPYLFMNTLTVTAAATNVATNVLKSAVAVGKVGGMALMSGGTYWNKKKNIIAKDDLAEDTHHQRKGALDVAVKPNVSTSLISLDVSLDEKIFPDEIFGNVLSMLIPIIIRVQNLVVDLFSLKHVDSGKNLPQTSTSNVTLKEWLDDLTKLREPVKDVKIQNKLNEVMERIFENVTSDITSILDCGAKLDLSIVLGMLIKLEEFIKEIENTSNLWCYNVLLNFQKKLVILFNKFVDEQQKIIEETKVTVKKRCGVLPIFKTFPIFIDRMELIISLSPHVEATSVSRQTLTKAYEKINKTLFETLEAVVKEISNIDSSSLDRSKLSSDDKEQVNAHIMMVENMHFIHSEIRQRKAVGLDNFVKISKASYDSSFGAYCKVVVRKPLGKLLEFFDGIEQLLKNQKPEEVSFNLTYSKTNLKNVIKKYPGKEIRRSLEELYRRVDKHYSEEEGSGQLLQVVWRGIQSEVVSNLRNFEELINKCYPDSGIRLEFTVDEILTYFSEFAKIH